MMRSRPCLRPAIRPGAVILLALLCYMAPLRAVGAFLLAVSVHELGHLGAIALCGGVPKLIERYRGIVMPKIQKIAEI